MSSTVQESMNICPNLVSQSVCTEQNCSHNHKLRWCSLCKVICPNEVAFKAHLIGRKHTGRAKSQTSQSFCETCNIVLSSQLVMRQHVQGKRHRRRAAQRTETAGVQQEQEIRNELSPGFVHCEACDTILLSENESRHQQSNAHRTKAQLFATHTLAETDKNGVSVKGELDFGFIEVTNPSSIHALNIEVILTLQGEINISEITLASTEATIPRRSHFSFKSSKLPLCLIPEVPERVIVNFNPQGLRGRYSDRLEIVFFDLALNKQFVITRSLRAIVGNQADWELLKPSVPYKPVQRKTQEPEKVIIQGVKPPPIANMEQAIDLPQSAIPKTLEAVLVLENKKEVVKIIQSKWLPQTFNSNTHGLFFEVLLHAEEAQMTIDIQRYDMQNVELNFVSPYYRLFVPGLAEKRPSVIFGDRILVQPMGSKTSGSWFEGYVHKVYEKDVDLRFHSSFKGLKGQRYNVRFKLGRVPLRRMHKALTTPFTFERVLFPSNAHIENRSLVSDADIQIIHTFDRNIQSNVQQLLAVATILHMPEGSIPFVVFGPPGTGKTVTVVEAIRQIMSANPDARILACAPSNSAADLFIDRLKDDFTPSQMFRLNASTRSKAGMSKALRSYSQINPNGEFNIPSPSKMKTFQIIIVTCISSFHASKLGRGYFSHVFIDEAGQASEPEVMVPIRMVCGNKTNIILSGDPKQLGPIVRSIVAAPLGLETSFLDRLVGREVYEPSIGHGISFVKLIKNYRNHPTILKYPNEQFYENELEAHASERITHNLLLSDELVSPSFPIIFDAIVGRDMREASSPSFFNPDEASVVRGYVERLLKNKRIKVQDTQIGVIAPYHAQVMKIRTLLQKDGHPGVKVGSVEEFQGQERRVIIVSTVRSSIEYVEFDLRHTLGFVANPRRFNVAVTRAQALLIVVGDPAVLSLDPLWRGFMNYVYLNDGWRGVQPDWDPTEPVTEEDYGATRRKMALEELERLKGKIYDTSSVSTAEEGDEVQELEDEN